MILKMRK